MVVLAGMTGSWKTALLREFPAAAVVDLEAMAVHRGSTFGAIDGMPQPSQATFENALGASLFGGRRERLIEDESAGIGRVYLPRAFRGAMLAAPAIVLECPADERAANIYEEYVATPLAQGKSPAAHQDRLVANLRGIERRLGSQLTGDLVQRVGAAFAAATRDLHLEWISLLLSSYYDRAYQHAFQAKPRTVLFRGSREECRQWISRRFA
jgi:tRNA 2-selenouridine synthase